MRLGTEEVGVVHHYSYYLCVCVCVYRSGLFGGWNYADGVRLSYLLYSYYTSIITSKCNQGAAGRDTILESS